MKVNVRKGKQFAAKEEKYIKKLIISKYCTESVCNTLN